MKIDNEQLISVANRYRSEQLEKKGEASRSGSKKVSPGVDRVELSVNAGEVEQLKQTMQGISDVRTEKVAAIKKAIDDGTYSVQGTQVAEKMLNYWKALNDDK